jgi:hypothetical protein
MLLRMNLPLLAEGAAGASDGGERVIRLVRQVETLNHELVEALVYLPIQRSTSHRAIDSSTPS